MDSVPASASQMHHSNKESPKHDTATSVHSDLNDTSGRTPVHSCHASLAGSRPQSALTSTISSPHVPALDDGLHSALVPHTTVCKEDGCMGCLHSKYIYWL